MWLLGKPEDEEAMEASPIGQQRAGRRMEEMGLEGQRNVSTHSLP